MVQGVVPVSTVGRRIQISFIKLSKHFPPEIPHNPHLVASSLCNRNQSNGNRRKEHHTQEHPRWTTTINPPLFSRSRQILWAKSKPSPDQRKNMAKMCFNYFVIVEFYSWSIECWINNKTLKSEDTLKLSSYSFLLSLCLYTFACLMVSPPQKYFMSHKSPSRISYYYSSIKYFMHTKSNVMSLEHFQGKLPPVLMTPARCEPPPGSCLNALLLVNTIGSL